MLLSLILLKISSYTVQTKKNCLILENLGFRFFKVEKNPLKVEKSGVFVAKKGSLILLKISSYIVQTK